MQKKELSYIFYFIPFIILGYLSWKNISPVLEVEYKIDGKTAIVSEMVPLSRISELFTDEKGEYRIIKDEPVYLDVRLPRKYNTVELEIEYSDLNNALFELGVSRDEARTNFDFVTLENQVLDNLEWKKIESDGLVLYQRKDSYKSIDEFLSSPPKFDETLVYRAELMPKTNKLWGSGKTYIDFPVKEKIKMLVYGSDIKTKIEAVGEYTENRYKIDDDLYKIEIVGNENTIFQNIEIDSPYVAILDGLKIGDTNATEDIYLAGSRLLARAEKMTGVQDIKIGTKTLKVEDIFMQYKYISDNRSLKKISIPKGNIELGGTIFFLRPYYLFYPRYEIFYSDADLKGVNYILTKYDSPQENEGVKTARAFFDITDTPTPYNKLRFLLSLPNADSGDLVKIRSIKLKFIGEKLSIKDIFNKIYYTLIAKR